MQQNLARNENLDSDKMSPLGKRLYWVSKFSTLSLLTSLAANYFKDFRPDMSKTEFAIRYILPVPAAAITTAVIKAGPSAFESNHLRDAFSAKAAGWASAATLLVAVSSFASYHTQTSHFERRVAEKQKREETAKLPVMPPDAVVKTKQVTINTTAQQDGCKAYHSGKIIEYKSPLDGQLYQLTCK